jgi:hypothetical protein
MTRNLALGVAAAVWLASSPGNAAEPFKVSIDDCVDADRKEVLRLLEVELRATIDTDAGASPPEAPASDLFITCTAERDVVEVRDRGRPSSRPRLLDLRALGAEARKARARELVLVIREMLETPDDALPRRSPTPPKAAAPRKARSLAELALLGGIEKYSGGHAQLGATLGFRLAPLSLLVLEARAGARLSPALHAPAGDIAAKGLAGALGIGISVFPSEGSAGLVLLSRLQADWVSIQGTSNLDGSVGQSADGWALALGLASSAWLALGRNWRLTLEPALLLPIQELAIVDRGRPIASVSGLGAAANIGVAVRL